MNLITGCKQMEVIYKTIDDIPEESKFLFERLIKNGILNIYENNNINITEEMYKIIIIISRLGLI